MKFANPTRFKALYECGFYMKLEGFPKILDVFLYIRIHCDSTTQDELSA